MGILFQEKNMAILRKKSGLGEKNPFAPNQLLSHTRDVAIGK